MVIGGGVTAFLLLNNDDESTTTVTATSGAEVSSDSSAGEATTESSDESETSSDDGGGGGSEDLPEGTSPEGLGDDPELDALAQDCFDGDMEACDNLFFESDIDSAYETYAATCGGRLSHGGVTRILRPDLPLTWRTVTASQPQRLGQMRYGRARVDAS